VSVLARECLDSMPVIVDGMTLVIYGVFLYAGICLKLWREFEDMLSCRTFAGAADRRRPAINASTAPSSRTRWSICRRPATFLQRCVHVLECVYVLEMKVYMNKVLFQTC